MTKNFRLSHLVAAAAIAVSAVSLSPKEAAAETVLTYAPWLPASYVLHTEVWKPWAEEVAKVTEGRVKIEFLPKAVGSPTVQFDVVRDGGSDIVVGITGYTPGRYVPEELGEMPLLSSDVADLSPAFYEIYQKYMASTKPFENGHVITIFSTTPTFLATTKPIKTIDDLKGLKLRAQSAAAIPIIQALDAVPVQKPVSELYELMSSGILDGSFLAFQPILGWKLQDVLKYVTVIKGGMGQSVMAMVVNQDKWNAIDEKDRAAIDKISGLAMAKQVGAAYAAAEIKARKDLEANGNVITEASPELVADIKKRLEPIEQDWVKRAKEKGMADPQAALNELRANVGG
ncbi:MAG: TRAP transporter substrate-binding protein [Rhodobiaceae bacterium]|nr:TRAP transporter substrate-binding protein [Rhodobiaceae bacterium]MCC0056230.1 TRAP transporter substrate-binding protein [Rhodobiaceae bacterium]